MTVDPDWWKDLFDGVYLRTDARSIGDPELTRREVDFLQTALDLDPDAPVLDLCGGQGRHALELCRRGHRRVTVLDYSDHLVRTGYGAAVADGLPAAFVRGDARRTGLGDGRFGAVIVMGSSFGYFVDEAENRKLIREAFRVLAPGGSLLMDLPDRAYVIRCFTPESTHQPEPGLTVRRERRLEDDLIVSRERVETDDGDCIRDRTYCTRLYTPDALENLITGAGFVDVRFSEDFMSRDGAGDFGFMTHRMVVVAAKPEKSP